MANAEYAIDDCKSILENYLQTELEAIEVISGQTSNRAPSPSAFLIGERDPGEMVEFPSILVIPDMSYNADDEYKFEERTLMLDIVCWVVEADEEKLTRFVMRYGDAVGKTLIKPDRWKAKLHSPKIRNIQYTGIYDADHGLAMACRAQIEIGIIND